MSDRPDRTDVDIDGDVHGDVNIAQRDIVNFTTIVQNIQQIPILSSLFGRIAVLLIILGALAALLNFGLNVPQRLGLVRAFKPASAEEVLVVVTDFTGSGGISASARITRALTERVQNSDLEHVRIERLEGEAPIVSDDARAVGQTYNATLVIWGTADEFGIEPFYEVSRNQQTIETRTDLGPTTADLPTFSAYVVEGVPNEFEYLMLFSLGQIAYFSQDFEEAIELFSQALSVDLGSEERTKELDVAVVHFYRGFSERQIGQSEAAIEDYSLAIDADGEFSNAYKNRGTAYYLEGEYEAALDDYERVLELDPDDDGTYFNLGIAYISLGDYETALTNFEKAQALNPEFVDTLVNMGFIHMELGEFQAAIDAFDAALELEPEYSLALNNKAYTLYVMGGDLEEALSLADQAIALDPDNPEALHTRGAIYHGLGDVQKAIDDFDSALDLKPTLAHVYRDRGWALFASGESQAALDDLDKAIELDSEDADAFYYRATLHDELGNVDSALDDYRQFLTLSETHKDEWTALAEDRIDALEDASQ